MLFRVLGLLFPGLDPKPLVEELRARLVEELDYRSKPTNQRLFADWYAGHPFIHVPAVVDELSTARVLTTELATGARFAEVEGWSQDERNRAAEAIFRFVFRSIYRLHTFNGDPHPGNYLFGGHGRVTFLDFGLVKRYTADEVGLFEELIQAMVIEHDITRFRRALEAHTCCGPPTTSPTPTCSSTSVTSTSSCSTTARSRSPPSTRRRRYGECSTCRIRTRTLRSRRTCRPRS